jgi:hypothetical protein
MVAGYWSTIHHKEASPMAQKISVLGIDIAKLVFHVVGMDDTGHVVLRKRIARGELLHVIATLPPALIGMEACGSAHYWAQRFREHGHEVQLIAPQFVKAYVKSPKNDTRDVEAICEGSVANFHSHARSGMIFPIIHGESKGKVMIRFKGAHFAKDIRHFQYLSRSIVPRSVL